MAMNPRAALLIAALLASPTWSQEPPVDPKVLTPRSFDRNSDSIKKIVRDFAASQSMPIQLAKEEPTHSTDTAIEFVPAEPPPPEPPPPRLPDPPPESPDTFFSAMIGTLMEVGLDSLLDLKDDTYTCVSNGPHCVSSDPVPPAPLYEP